MYTIGRHPAEVTVSADGARALYDVGTTRPDLVLLAPSLSVVPCADVVRTHILSGAGANDGALTALFGELERAAVAALDAQADGCTRAVDARYRGQLRHRAGVPGIRMHRIHCAPNAARQQPVG